MANGFRSDTPISQPNKNVVFKRDVYLGGLFWDDKEGIFVPPMEEANSNYIEEPIMSALVRKIADE